LLLVVLVVTALWLWAPFTVTSAIVIASRGSGSACLSFWSYAHGLRDGVNPSIFDVGIAQAMPGYLSG